MMSLANTKSTDILKPLNKWMIYIDEDAIHSNNFDCDCLSIPLAQAYPEERLESNRKYYTVNAVCTLPVRHHNTTYQAVFIPSHSKIAVMNDAAYQSLRRYRQGAFPEPSQYELSRIFLRFGFISPKPQDNVLDSNFQNQTEPLVAWLHMTNACNLECSYCYIDKSQQHMEWEIAKASVDSLVRSAKLHSYNDIVLKYAGGEPTLRLGMIERVHEYALSQIAPHMTLRGTILSNGVGITRHRARLIKNLELGLTISLDGIGEAHDRQRPTRSGKGSSEYVIKGIENAIAAGITPAISITVTAKSGGELLDTISWILEKELPFNIHYYRKHQPDTSTHQMRLAEAEIISTMRLVLQRIEKRLPERSLLNALVDYSDMSHSHKSTCFAGRSYLVYGHRGQISACQMLMQESYAHVDDEDSLQIIREKTQNMFPEVDEKEGCKDCEWRYWCGGGCPVEVYRATGRRDIKSPYCNIYKTFFPEIIRLEALRLLEYEKKAKLNG